MYCPRCGSPNTETTKFCRQCGLPLNQVAGYVSTGGTSSLTPPPSASSSVGKLTEGMTPRQKLILTIVLLLFLPGVLAVLGDVLPFIERLTPVAGVLMIPAILWAIFRYKAEKARLRRQHEYAAPQQPYQTPQFQNPMAPPGQLSPPPTNPLGAVGSIVEDETRKLPINNQ